MGLSSTETCLCSETDEMDDLGLIIANLSPWGKTGSISDPDPITLSLLPRYRFLCEKHYRVVKRKGRGNYAE